MPNPSQFLQLPDLDQYTSNFPKNWTNTMTLKMGALVPIMCKEVLPGDHWRGKVDIFLRFMPLFAPVMHKVNLFTHFFYVPARILWNNSSQDSFETFLVGGRDGKTKPIPPFIKINGADVVSRAALLLGYSQLADYLNVNVQHFTALGQMLGLEFSQLPFRAYQSICDEYYRNKNLQDSYYNEIGKFHEGGFKALSDTFTDEFSQTRYYSDLFQLRQRLWEDDYFTSALPTPERGDPVNIPFATVGDLNVHHITGQSKNGLLRYSASDGLASDIGFIGSNSTANLVSRGLVKEQLYDSLNQPITDGDGHETESATAISAANSGIYYDPNGTLHVTVNSIKNNATIRDLRIASLAERFQEISMNTMPDYRHFVNAFFDVVVPDYRLQLPELVGGGRQPVSFSEVTQTSASVYDDDDLVSAQGNLAGHGVSVPYATQNGHNFEFFAPEHGFLIGIVSVMPKTGYSQGLPKMYSRYDGFDYYLPLFETLPFQEVRNKELFVQPAGEGNTNEDTFGYQPRFSEYKYDEDEVHGDLKGNLKYWTMARFFDMADPVPSLNLDFVTSDPTKRIFNVTDPDVDSLVALMDFNVEVTRRMSKYTRI